MSILRRSHPRPALALCALLIFGCTTWSRRGIPPTAPIHARQQVKVWTDSARFEWHAVHMSGDSISGIPYWRPLTCDSCRVWLPLAEVDSIRLGDRESLGILIGAAPFVALGLLALLWPLWGGLD